MFPDLCSSSLLGQGRTALDCWQSNQVIAPEDGDEDRALHEKVQERLEENRAELIAYMEVLFADAVIDTHVPVAVNSGDAMEDREVLSPLGENFVDGGPPFPLPPVP